MALNEQIVDRVAALNLTEDSYLELYHEDTLRSAAGQLRRLVAFLGVEAKDRVDQAAAAGKLKMVLATAAEKYDQYRRSFCAFLEFNLPVDIALFDQARDCLLRMCQATKPTAFLECLPVAGGGGLRTMLLEPQTANNTKYRHGDMVKAAVQELKVARLKQDALKRPDRKRIKDDMREDPLTALAAIAGEKNSRVAFFTRPGGAHR